MKVLLIVLICSVAYSTDVCAQGFNLDGSNGNSKLTGSTQSRSKFSTQRGFTRPPSSSGRANSGTNLSGSTTNRGSFQSNANTAAQWGQVFGAIGQGIQQAQQNRQSSRSNNSNSNYRQQSQYSQPSRQNYSTNNFNGNSQRYNTPVYRNSTPSYGNGNTVYSSGTPIYHNSTPSYGNGNTVYSGGGAPVYNNNNNTPTYVSSTVVPSDPPRAPKKYSKLPILIRCPSGTAETCQYELISGSGKAFPYTIRSGQTQKLTETTDWSIRYKPTASSASKTFRLRGGNDYEMTQSGNQWAFYMAD